MDKITIYTDGACKGNPGPGGWGALIYDVFNTKEIYGGACLTTNNEMEMLAVAMSLNYLKTPSEITLYSDSKYVIDGMTKWIYGWERCGWTKSSKGEIKNLEIWQLLWDFNIKHEITWNWVRGHDGNEGNEIADELANKGIPTKCKKYKKRKKRS